MPYMVDSFEVFDGDNFSPITQLYGVLLHPIDYDSNNLDILPLRYDPNIFNLCIILNLVQTP